MMFSQVSSQLEYRVKLVIYLLSAFAVVAAALFWLDSYSKSAPASKEKWSRSVNTPRVRLAVCTTHEKETGPLTFVLLSMRDH
jgi:hypothetical protein